MGSYANFKNNDKHTNYNYDITNPEFSANVSALGKKEEENFKSDIDKWTDFISWARWNFDLFLDLITPPEGGIRLDLDQRIFMRSMGRFLSVYGVFPRGYGKTMVEILCIYITAVLYPDITISMSAQTKESSAKFFHEKHREILKFYPLLASEIAGKPNMSKDTIEITFTSGAVITNLANAQSSKGLRRHRLNIEEAALLNDELKFGS